jgi:hypothetical protein
MSETLKPSPSSEVTAWNMGSDLLYNNSTAPNLTPKLTTETAKPGTPPIEAANSTPALTSEGLPPTNTQEQTTTPMPELAAAVSTEATNLNPVITTEAPVTAPVEVTSPISKASVAKTPVIKPEAPVSLPEVSSVSSNDWERIDQEATAHFDLIDDPTRVTKLRTELDVFMQETEMAMQKQLVELGLAETAGSSQKMLESLNQAKAKKIAEMVATAYPYVEDDGFMARRRTNSTRESLAKILNMDPSQYVSLLEDWKRYKIDKIHGEALQDDKKYNIGSEKRASKREIHTAQKEYGLVLDQLSRLPLDKERGGQVDLVLKEYTDRLGKAETSNGNLIDANSLKEVSQQQALTELQEHLRQRYQLEGLKPRKIEARLRSDVPVLETWLAHIKPNMDPLSDLQHFENQRNKELMLTAKRQRAMEYIGSSLLADSLRNALGYEKPKPKSRFNLKEVFKRGVDHSNSRSKAGAEALKYPDKTGNYLGRVMTHLEMAKNLSRNEGVLMRSMIYLTALDRGLSEAAVAAWDKTSKEKKKKSRKQFSLGMAVTAMALARLNSKSISTGRRVNTSPYARQAWSGNQMVGARR